MNSLNCSGSSPLSRGIHVLVERLRAVIGIIPALAGNTGPESADATEHRDHPRSRGEYILSERDYSREYGIIPALAGNTCPHHPREDQRADHPRSRGEYSMPGTSISGGSGSSPLSRGIPILWWRSRIRTRIIPALAGNTTPAKASWSASSDHPRSRGEYMGGAVWIRYLVGSSPLSRGIRMVNSQEEVRERIIPALAGNTTSGSVTLAALPDHPRSRGEYRAPRSESWRGDGSSPLSRGIPETRGPHIQGDGIIPALAGNTMSRSASARPLRDHPRSRGEYPEPIPWIMPPFGSSPLSRGIRVCDMDRIGAVRIIPALAGNTTSRAICPRRSSDHPRSRGEYGSGIRRLDGDDGSSPLSRGIHLLTRDFISRTCRILGTPSSHVSASRSHSPRVCGGRHPGEVSRLALRLKDLGGPSGLAPHNRLAPMDHPMSGRTYLARS